LPFAPSYVNKGSTIGEHIILVPVNNLDVVEKDGVKTEPLKKTMRQASTNELHDYAYKYMKRKYGDAA
jgi:hypothetical protein